MSLADYEWDSFIEKFLQVIPYFKIVERKDSYGNTEYEWFCKGANSKWVESKRYYETKRECLEEFLEMLNGFEMKKNEN